MVIETPPNQTKLNTHTADSALMSADNWTGHSGIAAQTEPELGGDSIAVDVEGESICCMHPLEHLTDAVRAAVLGAAEVTLTLTLSLTLNLTLACPTP